MKFFVFNILWLALLVLSFVYAIFQVIIGHPVSPWNYALAALSAVIAGVGWHIEERRADRWMKRVLEDEPHK